jgi:DNA-binding transcriptional LysR family regulator
MQTPDWNDLRHVLALGRAGSYSGAARLLQVNSTTVARRIKVIESLLAVSLFTRDANGALAPTDAGKITIARAEAIEAEIGSLTATVKGADQPATGNVRLTTVPIIANRLLIPALPALLDKHRGLHIELIADARGYDLVRREADIALRFARPESSLGTRVLARRIATLDYAVYVSSATRGRGAELPWLTLEAGMAHLPQARWMAEMAPKHGGLAAVAVNDGDVLVHCVQSGLGRTLLPRLIGDRISGLKRVDLPGLSPPKRELWLLAHRDLRPLARFAVVIDWLAGLFAAGGD